MQTIFENRFYTLLQSDHGLIYRPAQSEEDIALSWPRFEINGEPGGCPANVVKTGEALLNDHIMELTAEGMLNCGARLKIEFRVCKETPIVRFRYILSSDEPMCLTKNSGENLTYFSYAATGAPERVEVRFSNYDQLLHRALKHNIILKTGTHLLLSSNYLRILSYSTIFTHDVNILPFENYSCLTVT